MTNNKKTFNDLLSASRQQVNLFRSCFPQLCDDAERAFLDIRELQAFKTWHEQQNTATSHASLIPSLERDM